MVAGVVLKVLAVLFVLILQLQAVKSETLLHTLKLSLKEQQWIKDHQIVTYSGVNWKPLSIIDDNKMKGIMGDFLELIAHKTGLKFVFVPSDSHSHVLKQFKQKQIDLIPGVGSSPQEKALGLLSHRYAHYPMVIVTDKSFGFLENLDAIKDKVVAVPKDYTSYNFMLTDHPHIKLKITKDIREALMSVATGQADAFVGHVAPSLHYLSELNLPVLTVSGQTSFTFDHHFLIQKELSELHTIINKAFAAISEEDKNAIYARWIQTSVQEHVDYALLWKVLALAFLILLLFFGRQQTLKKYTKELENQKELYTIVFENTSNGVLLIDTKTGRFIECNKQIVKILGYSSKEDVLNMHPSELSPEFQPDGRRSDEKANEMIAMTISEGFNNFEWKHIRETGEAFWSDITLTSIVLEGKNLIHVVWKDIDDKKKADTRFKDLSERMELALIGNNDGLFDWDLRDNSVYYSPRWKEMLGYRDEELGNDFSTWEERAHPGDIPEVLAAADACIEGKKEYFESVHRMKHKDGHWIWISARGKPLKDDDGHPIRLIGTHTDITEDKEMQIQFAHQVQIIKQVRDAIISTDLEGVITSWNIGAELLLGFKSYEVVGKDIAMLYDKEDFRTIEEYMDKIAQEGEYNISINLINKSNEPILSELSLSVLNDASGNPIGTIVYAQDVTERKEAEKKLHEQRVVLDYQAHHDALTGLPNRILFSDRLELGIKKAKRNQNKLALFFIDLDHFKQINDSLGHEVGDAVLMTVTERLESQIRNEDTFARLGGDEFTIIMENLHKSEDASRLAQKILDIMAEPILIEEQKLYVSTSIGISLYPEDGTDASNLLKYADTAMYKAKDEGRNNFQFYSSEMTEIAFLRVEMESALRQALEKEEFVVYYQPQINGQNGKLVGMEALIRWNHPEKGLIPPAQFLSFAEETGLIIAMDLWVMQTAMHQMVAWYKEGFNPGVLSLNLAIKQFQQKDFISLLRQMIETTQMQESWLEFEVTEGQIMTNLEYSIARLEEISDLGISLAVDDFGTGYSSLSYLKKLPIDKLKIDQSFIFGLPDDEDDMSITKAIISLSKNLNLSVIAEGVETKQQKDFLVANGCDLIQGYFYAKPIPAEDIFERFLKPKVLP